MTSRSSSTLEGRESVRVDEMSTPSLAAIFPSERRARMAARELDRLGYKTAWIGTINEDTAIEAMLSEGGLDRSEARDMSRHVRPYETVVTVVAHGINGRAREVLRAHGGRRPEALDPDEAPRVKKRCLGSSDSVY